MREPLQTPGARAWRYWLAILAVAMPVQMSVTASPFINGLAMDTRQAASETIGLIRSCEILLNASLMIWLSARLVHFAPKVLALAGLTGFIVGNLICGVSNDLTGLATGRLLAGAGAGAMVASLGAFVGRLASPHRAAALIAIPVTGGAIVTALLASAAADAKSSLGLFGLLATGGSLGLLLMAAAPGGFFHAAHSPPFRSMLRALRSPFVIACATIFMGSTAVWHFFQRIGLSHGLDNAAIGTLTVQVSLACALLAPAAAIVRDAWVRWTFIGSLIGFGAGSTLIPLAPDAHVYAAGYLLQSAAFTFYTLFVAAVAARLDRTGGIAAAGNGWQALGGAISPAIGGMLISGGAFLPLAVFCALASLATVTLGVIGTKDLAPTGAREKS